MVYVGTCRSRPFGAHIGGIVVFDMRLAWRRSGLPIVDLLGLFRFLGAFGDGAAYSAWHFWMLDSPFNRR